MPLYWEDQNRVWDSSAVLNLQIGGDGAAQEVEEEDDQARVPKAEPKDDWPESSRGKPAVLR